MTRRRDPEPSREAEDAEVVPLAGAAAPYAVGSVPGVGVDEEVPLPTVENDPRLMFAPRPGISSTDILEIVLAFLLQISNPNLRLAKGTLRTLSLEPGLAEVLSERALAHMRPVDPAPPAPEGQVAQ